MTPDLEPFRAHLAAKGFAPGTLRGYLGIVRAYLDEHPRRPIHLQTIATWSAAKLDGAPAGSVAIWTAGLRAWVAFHGLNPDIVQAPSRPAMPKPPEPLSEREIKAYLRATETCETPSIRCILQMLPFERADVGVLCRALPKWKPASPRSEPALREYRAFRDTTSPWLFPSILDATKPMPTDTVRKALRELRDGYDWTTRRLRLGVREAASA